MSYKKRPVTIEAFEMTRDARWDISIWPEWLVDAWSNRTLFIENDKNGRERMKIKTLEGLMNVSWNDWIIQGLKGELYPCKPDIFNMTYEEEDVV